MSAFSDAHTGSTRTGSRGCTDVPGLDATLPVATVQGDGRKGSAILRACAALPKGPGCATRRRSLRH